MPLGDTGLCHPELDEITAIDFETDGDGRLRLNCILPKVVSLRFAAGLSKILSPY
jgi:hypothetical protein